MSISIRWPAAGQGLELFPNPARHAATLRLPAGLGATVARLTLSDALGRVVRTRTLPAATASRTEAVLELAGLRFCFGQLKP